MIIVRSIGIRKLLSAFAALFLGFLQSNEAICQIPEAQFLTQFGGGAGGNAIVTNVAYFSNGDYLVGGSIRGLNDFDPTESFALKATNSSSNYDPFIARYTHTGNLV